jgi:hypothetical protein
MRGAAVAYAHADVLLGQIKAIQEDFRATAHEAFLDWGVWSRNHEGTTPLIPGVANSSLYDRVAPERPCVDRFYSADMPTRRFSLASTVQDPRDVEHGDLLRGQAVDEIIHQEQFILDWRNIVRAVYYFEVKHWLWPAEAKVKHHRFVREFDAALAFVQARL